MMEKTFQNKVIVITGASRGIGRASALAFAKQGGEIIGIYRQRHDMADSLVHEIEKLGGTCKVIQADLANPDEIKEKIVENISSIDILINNAGIVFDADFETTTIAEWKQTFDVNVIAPFLCAQYLTHHFKPGGAIVNLASISGLHSFYPEWMAYDGSKAWLSSITHSMAKAFAKYQVRVNAVAPGYVKTDMTSTLSEEFLAKITDQIYLNRLANPDEIAKVILFLASNDASFVNGTTLIADGGMG